MKGRRADLRTLGTALTSRRVTHLALVGGGGSGKSMLAAAAGHRVRRHFPGGAHWIRIGAWDHRTLLEMLAIRLGARRDPLVAGVRRELERRGPTLVVLDNHENDRALARFFDDLAGCPVTWLLTARRCLLAGVSIFPVVPPLINARRSAFPRVASLTALLRWNPLALDLANALVVSGAVRAPDLRAWMIAGGIRRVSVMEHEDDVVEVKRLVDWGWDRLDAGARRMLAALAHTQGDHIDTASLFGLARAGAGARAQLARLRRWHLVQEPFAGRFALHAVVRHAVAGRLTIPAERYFAHYVRLLERHPDRLDLEQTHLFAALDHAHASSQLGKIIRVQRLLEAMETAGNSA
jgi:hypothetical protein